MKSLCPFSSVQGRQKLNSRLLTANIEKTIITEKPELMAPLMMKDAIERVMAEKRLTRLVPMTRTWVGYSSVTQTKKKVHSAVMLKVITKTANKMPRLLDKVKVSPSAFGWQTKMSTNEQMRVTEKQTTATVFLGSLLMTKYIAMVERTVAMLYTTPQMKILSWNQSSIRLGAKQRKLIEICTTISPTLIHRSEGYRKMSSSVNFEAFCSSLSRVCSIAFSYAIYSTLRAHSCTPLTLAIHRNSLSASSGERRVTSTMGVSTARKTQATRKRAMGMMKKKRKACCQSLSQKQSPVSMRLPRLKKTCNITIEYSRQSLCTISEIMLKLMPKMTWIPNTPQSSPTAARQRLLASKANSVPTMVATAPMMTKVLRPKKSPSSDIMKQDRIKPTYMIRITRFMVFAYQLQRQSPNLFASVRMLCAGMCASRSATVRLQTQSRHEAKSAGMAAQLQSSWKNKKGVIVVYCPQTHAARKRRVRVSFWQVPKAPTLLIRSAKVGSGGGGEDQFCSSSSSMISPSIEYIIFSNSSYLPAGGQPLSSFACSSYEPKTLFITRFQ